ncbi:MAG: two-component regulator propeller domain-containing protein [Melioribacteraceae bacterium]
MRAIKICLIIISFTYSISAQTIGTWKIYSDMKNVSAAAFSSANIWAATSGGVFKFNTLDTTYSIMTKADGFNSQALTSVAVDNQNKIWFGSQEGYINVFDPSDNSIKRIIDIFNSGKNQKQINDLFIKGDTVFVSIDFGLLLINTKTHSIYDSFLKLGNFPAESKILSSYKLNLIYACTENGVSVQKVGAQNLSAPESWDTYQFGTSLPVQSVSRILEFNGQILLGTSNGIYRFVNRTWQPYTLQGTAINDMIVIGNVLYLISNNQLMQFSNGQYSIIYQNNNISFNSITGSANQGIFISTNSGLIQFKDNKSKIRYPNGPQTNSFVNLSVDPKGNLWVASGKDNGGSGFFKFDGSEWKVYNKSNYPQIPTNAYYNVYAAPDSAVYLSNWGTGVAVFKNNNFEFYSKNNSSISGFVKDTNFVPVSDVKTDSKGNMWVLVNEAATRKPLSVYTKQKQWYSYSFSNPFIGSDATDKMIIDQNDTKWFVIIKGNMGLYYFNENKTFTNLSDDTQGYIDGLLSNLVSSLAVDRKGYLWIGTNVGVNVITDPSKPKVTSNLGLALRNQTVTCIAIDPLDNKWIGTKQGVFVLSSDGIQVINNSPYNTKNSPLPNDDIKSIAFDAKNGIVYIGTDNGLAALQTSSIQPLQSFNQLLVYPNPFTPGDNNVTSLTIDGLIRNSSIKIFNISGNLIREIKTPGGKIAFWDGKDLNGNTVPTGIYIIVAYDEEANNVMTSKVAVIRK